MRSFGMIKRANNLHRYLEDRMSTSTLYDSTRQTLRQALPAIRESQLDTLALVVASATQTQSAHLADLARALPLHTTQDSKEQRIRRFLDNARITQATHYRPIARAALAGVTHQRVDLVLDRVLLHARHNVLVASVGFRRRSVPLAWQTLEHVGSSDVDDHKAVLQAALAELPAGTKVTVHADSEFRSVALFQWLREQDHDALLSIRGRTYVSETADGGQGQTLVERVGTRREVLYLSGVYVTEERYGPVNVFAWWSKDDDGKPLLRAVMTNLPATPRTKQRGRKRMWIETGFRDWQSGGFHLDQTGITDRDRLVRLLIPVLIAYIWLVSIGRWVVKRGYRRLIDHGAGRAWRSSLFQLGVGWVERLQSYHRLPPVMLYLYV
jgi:DDE family transposase